MTPLLFYRCYETGNKKWSVTLTLFECCLHGRPSSGWMIFANEWLLDGTVCFYEDVEAESLSVAVAVAVAALRDRAFLVPSALDALHTFEVCPAFYMRFGAYGGAYAAEGCK